MGYQITYTLTKDELSSEFIPMYKSEDELRKMIEDIKLQLKLIALIPGKEENISSIVKDINFKVRQYYMLLEDLAKHYIYDNICSEGEVYFCGWNYAHESDSDKQSNIDFMTENLCIQKIIVPTPDYFDDSERFSMKCDEINTILDYETIAFETIYSKFREKYYEKSDEYNSSTKNVEGVTKSEEE